MKGGTSTDRRMGNKDDSSYNSIKGREHERVVALGRQDPFPAPVFWRCPSIGERAHRFSLIGGVQLVDQG
jgi:hypothetical protein